MANNKKSSSSSREEYHKKYMQSYIHDETKGGKLEYCQACDCKYKKYNRHHHTSTAKHKRNAENAQLKSKTLDSFDVLKLKAFVETYLN